MLFDRRSWLRDRLGKIIAKYRTVFVVQTMRPVRV
jgi:hypothetical protein